MRRLLTFFLLITFFSCSRSYPKPDCSNFGQFVMSIKNQKAAIKYNTDYKKFVLHFSLDGSLESNLIGVPCKLDSSYQGNVDVYINADLFKLSDSTKNDSVYAVTIRKIEFQ